MQVLIWLSGAVILALVVRLIRALRSVASRREYWHASNESFIDENYILLVLGDSAAQGVGASKPEKSVVGLIADYIETEIHQKVSVINLSVSGARVSDVFYDQIPQANAVKADMVIFIASANDALKGTPLDDYETDLYRSLRELPKDRTIVADMPWVRRRKEYMPILHKTVSELGLELAAYDSSARRSRFPLVYVAGDFLHPSDRGYKDIWFATFKPSVDKLIAGLKTEAK